MHGSWSRLRVPLSTPLLTCAGCTQEWAQIVYRLQAAGVMPEAPAPAQETAPKPAPSQQDVLDQLVKRMHVYDPGSLEL